MSRIDFFTGAKHRLKDAAKVAKYYVLKHGRLCVYCSDKKRLNFFSLCLWDTEAEDFIAHLIFNKELPSSVLETPTVWLVQDSLKDYLSCIKDQSALLNLDHEVPEGYLLFDQVLEVVSEIDQDKSLARQRWKHYKAFEENSLRSYDYEKSLEYLSIQINKGNSSLDNG